MASETWIERGPELSSSYLQKFRLYETRSNFYLIGRDKSKTLWRVLKIDRTEPVELNIHEDPTNYSETECFELLRRIHEGNRSTGGLKFKTTCYGIIGFVRFLGPYYMLIITKRKKLGAICGQTIYSISKSEMVIIPNASAQSSVAYSKDEKRYKKLLCTVDLTKDFYFSYSYHVMHSLQKNLCNNENGQAYYESMFVWNEYLTRGIRNNLKNNMWTVALVYGFFKQIQLSIAGKNCKLTLIARRSRYYAGTRYLKRGVNEKGRVANDVETEQIVFEDVPEGFPVRISSVLQNRGSIPLSWSQETSRLNIKPDIILSTKDSNYEATRLHFENLVKRYGNPIIILNLIKTREKRPRETILRAEFANAIRFINKGLSKENRLRPLHWDLHKHSRNKAMNVLAILSQLATYALNLTGIFYCQLSPALRVEGLLHPSISEEKDGACPPYSSSSKDEEATNLAEKDANDANGANVNNHIYGPMFQKGVLRTNCIDCLDRTNVAQYAYGLVALGRQLHALGITISYDIDLDNPLAEDLMGIYETMGDTLALQYGGSAAHNKIFSERRGQWKAATQSQELFRTLQRYYSNAYMDAEKQDAINVFLGYFQPQAGKPALWELGSDQHYKSVRLGSISVAENSRSMIKRSLSEGSILCESDSAVLESVVGNGQQSSEKKQDGKGLSGSVSCPRQPFEDGEKDHVLENDCFCFGEHGGQCKCTNFDLDWISSSGNSCEEDSYTRSVAGQSSDNNITSDDIKIDSTTSASRSLLKGEEKKGSEANNNEVAELPKDFVQWVIHGECFFR